jgi:predicted nucleic acid-binding protein
VAALYRTIIVPPAVMAEITLHGAGSSEFAQADWLTVREPADKGRVAELQQSLDAGEAETIALALETNAVLLIDERLGRRHAIALGLSCIRSGALLVAAKQAGLIDAVRPVVLAMEQRGVHLGDEAIRAILRAAGEE